MKTEQLLDVRVAVNEKHVSWREIDGETVFLQKEEKAFYELNPTAEIAWKGVLAKKKVKDIVGDIHKKHKQVNADDVTKDVVSFIKDGIKKNIFLIAK